MILLFNSFMRVSDAFKFRFLNPPFRLFFYLYIIANVPNNEKKISWIFHSKKNWPFTKIVCVAYHLTQTIHMQNQTWTTLNWYMSVCAIISSHMKSTTKTKQKNFVNTENIIQHTIQLNLTTGICLLPRNTHLYSISTHKCRPLTTLIWFNK